MKKILLLLTAFTCIIAFSKNTVAQSMSDYCSTPPYATMGAVKPNLLLMIDNSASMNDLQYINDAADSIYCYDNTYDNTASYTGYFNQDTVYDWKSGSGKFEDKGGNLQATCNHKTDYLCVDIGGAGPTVTKFEATGKFLNWLSASKIDILKQILTGGKYNSTDNYLEAESRGCVGKRFVKAAPVADFISGGDITFGIRGTVDNPNEPLSVSQGGNTIIEIFDGSFDPGPCQSAIDNIDNQGQFKQDVIDCLNLGGGVNTFRGQIRAVFNHSIHACWKLNRGDPIPPGTYNTIQGDCGKIYDPSKWNILPGDIQPNEAHYICADRRKTCTNTDPIQICDEDSDCPAGETCADSGLDGFLGQCWVDANTIANAWSDDGSNCEETQIENFCGFLEIPEVIDPTDSTSDTGELFNLPAYLIDSGVLAQAGDPVGEFAVKVDMAATPTGLIHDYENSIRFGVMRFNYCGSTSESILDPNIKLICEDPDNPAVPDKDASKIISYIGDADTVDAVNSIKASTWTPFAEAFYNAIAYYVKDATDNPNLDATKFTASSIKEPINSDDFATNKNPIQYSCQKNNILLISDGASTADLNNTMTEEVASYNDGDTDDTGTCGNYSGSSYLDDLSYIGKNKNIFDFSDSDPSDDEAAQRITTYVVYSGAEVSPETGECNPKTLMENTATNGGTSLYNPQDPEALSADIGTAFEEVAAKAASGTAVSVLTTSSRGVGSLLQAYFLPTRQDGTREILWTGYTKNIWLDPDDNLREDTVPDFKLRLDQDYVMKLYFKESTSETKAGLFTTDADGGDDGLSTSLQSCSNPIIKEFSEIQAMWEAGEKLANMNPSARNIFTSKNVIDGESTTYTFTNNDFTVSNVTSGLDDGIILNAALNPDATYTAGDIVRYIRGECRETGVIGDTPCDSTTNSDFRDRRIDVNGSLKVWKLGDIISSTPKVFANTPLNTYIVDYGDITYYQYTTRDEYNYKKKSSIAFVGANDGMLHAFRVGYLKDKDLSEEDIINKVKAKFQNFFSVDTGNDKLGEEVWAYIPFNAFPYLKYLANLDYCHIYYADLPIRLIDASIDTTSEGGNSVTVSYEYPEGNIITKNWATILIGGMRFGGACSGSDATPSGPPISGIGFSSYFAIDITDPENPVPLWEFSDADMGYATTYPSVIRTGKSAENGNWYVVFGSGSKQLPNPIRDIARSTTGYIYVLNLTTGDLVNKIPLDDDGNPSVDDNAIVGDILAIDADRDYVAEKIYFGTSYNDSGTWKGKLMRIDIPDEALSPLWTPSITTLFSGSYPFTASPEVTKDKRGRLWVFEGSGKYFSDLDEQDTSQQIFLGLKDVSGIPYPVGEDAIDNVTTLKTIGTVTETEKICVYDSATDTFKLKDVVTSIIPSPEVSPVAIPEKGWKIYLSTKERVISRPLAVGGILDFLTYVPSADVCSLGGDSYLYSVGYTTGVAPANISIHSPDITSDTTGEVTVYKRILLGPGAPPTGEAIIIPPPEKGELKKKIQIATGVIVETENEAAISIRSKIMHWLRK